MKTLKFKRNSWHHWLAEFGSVDFFRQTRSETTDICFYASCVLMGLLKLILTVLFLIFLAGAVLWLLGVYLYGGYLLLFTEHTILGTVGPGKGWSGVSITTFVLFTGAALILGLTELVIRGLKRLRLRVHHFTSSSSTTDSFIMHAFSAFKNKTCVRVEFIKDEEK